MTGRPSVSVELLDSLVYGHTRSRENTCSTTFVENRIMRMILQALTHLDSVIGRVAEDKRAGRGVREVGHSALVEQRFLVVLYV